MPMPEMAPAALWATGGRRRTVPPRTLRASLPARDSIIAIRMIAPLVLGVACRQDAVAAARDLGLI
jgi:hypothetical protein